jgi:hypothetical protein
MCHVVLTYKASWTPGAQFSPYYCVPFEITTHLNMETHSGRLITAVALERLDARGGVSRRHCFLGFQRVKKRCLMQDSYVTFNLCTARREQSGLHTSRNSSLPDNSHALNYGGLQIRASQLYRSMTANVVSQT